MKLLIQIDIGELEVETSDAHGNIEAVFLDGEDVSELSVSELIMKHIGERKWQDAVCRAADEAKEASLERRFSS